MKGRKHNMENNKQITSNDEIVVSKERLSQLISEIEKFELTDEEKKKYSGSYIKLPAGETHYEMKGEGEAVVLVHGYATPYYIYDKIFDFLVEKGYKVIRYDLLGRGFSERVPGNYTPDLFASQLEQLTDALIPDGKFFLFGTSMGGAVVTAFAAKRPERVRKLFLLAPAGMEYKTPLYMKLANKPLIGELMFKALGGRLLLTRSCAELIYSKEQTGYYLEKFAEGARYKGFLRATLSSLRNTLMKPEVTVANYKKVAQKNIPVCTIWGTADKTMPYYQSKQLSSIFPDMHLYTFEGSGHIFLFDEGERTCGIIINEMTGENE